MSLRLKFFLLVCFILSIFITNKLKAQSKKIDSLKNFLNSTSGNRLGFVLDQLSVEFRSVDYKKSVDYALQSFEESKKGNDSRLQASSLLHAGMAYYYQGNHKEALDFYFRSLKISEEANDNRGSAAALNEMGTLQKKNNNLSEAGKNLTRALQLSIEIDDSSQVANSMNNLGHVFELQNDFDRAMDFYKRSAKIKEQLNDFYGLSFNHDNIANILSKQGKYDEAGSYFQKSIDYFKSVEDKASYAIALNNLGEMFHLKRDYSTARKYLLQSLAVSTKIKYQDLSQHIYRVISETYLDENNFKDGYSYFLKSSLLKDSIFDETKSKQLIELQTKYDTEKKETKINLLTQETRLKSVQLRQGILAITVLVLLLVALVGIGLLLRNRTKLKQQADLEAARAELRQQQLQAVIASQEEERKRFAADLHDGLGQMISAMRLGLSKNKIDTSSVQYALGLMNDMNVEIRNIAFNLMPQVLVKDGLHEALHEFAQRVSNSGGIKIEVQTYNLSQDMSSEQRIALYRICQEWVNNVIKYSDAKEIMIQAVQHAEELVITIEDDGNGFDQGLLTEGKGNGWKNINSRLSLIRGTIDIDTLLHRKGTISIISVPT